MGQNRWHSSLLFYRTGVKFLQKEREKNAQFDYSSEEKQKERHESFKTTPVWYFHKVQLLPAQINEKKTQPFLKFNPEPQQTNKKNTAARAIFGSLLIKTYKNL